MRPLIEFTIPAGPSTNLMYRHTKRGHYRTKEYKNWLSDAYSLILTQVKPVSTLGPVTVAINAQPKDGRIRDVDNYCKAILDGLEHWGFIANDRQVTYLTVTRAEPNHSEHLIGVRLWESLPQKDS